MSVGSTDLSVPESPTFEGSPRSTASSPLVSTPPGEVALPSPGKAPATAHEPPSPPMSDASAPPPKSSTASKLKTPGPSTAKKSRLPSADHSTTPKPRAALSSSTSMRPPGARAATGSQTRTPAPTRTSTARAASQKIPTSSSLTHIRSLTAQMQRLEARVQNARSKLPGPISTPPRASPRSSVVDGGGMPSTVTMRSRKRTIGSTASSSVVDDTPSQPAGLKGVGAGKHVSRLSTSGVSRLSFGPLPNRGNNYDPDNSSVSISRPSSRASVTSGMGQGTFAKPERPASRTEIARPMSRTSLGGARTPMGLRPRSSLSGSLHGHNHSQSVGHRMEFDETEEEIGRTPSRRGTYSKFDPDGAVASSIPAPSGIPGPRRQSAGLVSNSRRVSGASTKLDDLGETY
jgi:hypothetical protein